MGKLVLASLIVGLTVLAEPLSVEAAANCSATSDQSPMAKTVCGDPSLLSKDRAMDEAYEANGRARIRRYGNAGNLTSEQDAWIAEAKSCGDDASCLLGAFDRRIAALKDQTERFDSDGEAGSSSAPLEAGSGGSGNPSEANRSVEPEKAKPSQPIEFKPPEDPEQKARNEAFWRMAQVLVGVSAVFSLILLWVSSSLTTPRYGYSLLRSWAWIFSVVFGLGAASLIVTPAGWGMIAISSVGLWLYNARKTNALLSIFISALQILAMPFMVVTGGVVLLLATYVVLSLRGLLYPETRRRQA